MHVTQPITDIPKQNVIFDKLPKWFLGTMRFGRNWSSLKQQQDHGILKQVQSSVDKEFSMEHSEVQLPTDNPRKDVQWALGNEAMNRNLDRNLDWVYGSGTYQLKLEPKE
jgi:hypothetical protein